MTTLQNRPHTALLIIDMQVGVMAKAVGRDAVVRKVATPVVKAKLQQISAILVRHCGQQLIKGCEGWQTVQELHPWGIELLLEKVYDDAFEDTGFEADPSRWKSRA